MPAAQQPWRPCSAGGLFVVLLASFAAWSLGGCTALLDPDELVVSDGTTDTATDEGAVDANLADDDGGSTDRGAPVDLGLADLLGRGDDGPAATDDGPDPADTLSADDGGGGDAGRADDGSSSVDDGPSAPEIVVALPGDEGRCDMQYRRGIAPPCPSTCPGGGGWSFVVDASASRGVDRWIWSFTASSGYRIHGVDGDRTARPTVHVDFDTDGVCTNYQVRPGTIFVKVQANGGPKEDAGEIDIVVGEAGACGAAPPCAEP